MSDELPYLGPTERFAFPSPHKVRNQGPVCAGGNLSPGFLLSAYEQGLFPWYSPEERGPILWWSPDPRFVLVPEEIHVGKRLRRYFNTAHFEISWDQKFEEVMTRCGSSRDLTWIDRPMLDGYKKLHELGYAHSCEVWLDGALVGGLYGVRTGRIFSGESMFSQVANSSKVALIELCSQAKDLGLDLIDCQMETPYLRSMGAKPISRRDYLAILDHGLEIPSTNWF